MKDEDWVKNRIEKLTAEKRKMYEWGSFHGQSSRWEDCKYFYQQGYYLDERIDELKKLLE